MTTFLDGYYKLDNHFCNILMVENGSCAYFDGLDKKFPLLVEYGDFGEAFGEVKEKTGKSTYNVRIKYIWNEEIGEAWKDLMEKYEELGVISMDGSKCSVKTHMGISDMIKITNEEKRAMDNNFDPIESPPGPYKIQPEVDGHIIWLTGAPGLGKSTTAQLLAREDGYVYYEADCFAQLKNPYLPLDEDGSLAEAVLKQKTLKGEGIKERAEAAQIMQDAFAKIIQGQTFDTEEIKKYYQAMATDILNEKRRIGGHWAIAHVVLQRKFRDCIREILGPNLIFIQLTMSQEERRERVRSRHKGAEDAVEQMDAFEKLMEEGQEDEPKTINLAVTVNMSKKDVVETVKKRINDICK